jgi:hypothetical protein
MKECLACGKPLPREGWKKHREREYCNNACKMRVYRQRKARAGRTVTAMKVEIAERPFLHKRIQELERALAECRFSNAECRFLKTDLYLERFTADNLKELVASQKRLLGYKDEKIAAYEAYLRVRGLSQEEIDRISTGY